MCKIRFLSIEFIEMNPRFVLYGNINESDKWSNH